MRTSKPVKIALLGGGSWATALVKMLSENEVVIHWWLRSESDIRHLRTYRHNPSYLSSVQVDLEKVKPTSHLEKALEEAQIVIVAIPSAFVAHAIRKLDKSYFEDKLIASAVKGMIPEENVLITEYFERKFELSADNFLIIAGPCHAEEVAMERQSYLTIGGNNRYYAEKLAELLRSRFVNASVVDDVYGVEYCAVMKNIIAVACGISHGLNNGDNFQAVLVSNALEEIDRFINTVTPHEKVRNLHASAYLGDLLVTTYSQFSRNRTFGSMIGRGYSVRSAQMEMNMVAEGYYAVRSIYKINKKYKVNLPITTAVYNILYEKISPVIEFRILKNLIK